MKKILICSMRSGAGHVMAAKALEEEFKKRSDVECKNVDFLDSVNILSKEFYGRWYLDMVNAVPQFYGWLYESIKPNTTDFRLIFDRINAQEFQKMLFDYNPDVFLATNFVPMNIATYWRKQYKLNYKVYLVVTDYEAHPLLVDKSTDGYFVPTEEVKQELIAQGIDEDKIKVTGIPVDLKFSKELKTSTIRQSLGLSDNLTILVTFGGFGVGRVKEVIENLQSLSEGINIIAIAGKNEELYKELTALPEKSNTKVFSFVENMEELMAASDLIVGKSGGLTVTESLALGRPIVVINPIPGQEVANANYLTRNLAGQTAADTKELIKIVKNLSQRPDLIKQMQTNAKKISLPEGALSITQKVMSS